MVCNDASLFILHSPNPVFLCKPVHWGRCTIGHRLVFIVYVLGTFMLCGTRMLCNRLIVYTRAVTFAYLSM